ncbi:GNAT family N-acetyltransferase [Microbacterium aurantiacum]|uniref:GNAT family N-acetyltransferase n=1 Tax=Microbacterium aurantiacum TaxID=162393 RepID=UPI000C7F9A80|nr:GNAT family N-acetyltransferase [Microbacterium aurantiacum]
MTDRSSMVVVREASFPEDEAAVSALLEDYLKQTEAEKADHDLTPRAAALPDRYAHEITDPEKSLAGMRVLVASVDGVDRGIIVVSRGAEVSEIKRFWTTPPARGHGVGSALIGEALRHAARPVRLSVWDWREPAIRMYRGLGFSPAVPWDERERLLFLELI